MRLRPLGCLALLALASTVSLAQNFTIAPANPTPMDRISIRKSFDNEDSMRTRVSMSNNRITVKLQLLDVFFPEPPPGTFAAPIGRLPAGDYQVEVVNVDRDGNVTSSLGVRSFTVAPRAAGHPVDDYSDIWWNPSESGWGMNIAQHASGQLYATWFVYGADGSPIWYVMPGGKWAGAGEFDGDVYRTTGRDIAHFDPTAVIGTKVGTARLLVYENVMTAILDFDDIHTIKQLVRQSF